MSKIKTLELVYDIGSYGNKAWTCKFKHDGFRRSIICANTINKMAPPDESKPMTLCISKRRPKGIGKNCLHYLLNSRYTNRMRFLNDEQFKTRDIYAGLAYFCDDNDLLEGYIWLVQ
jgi:hypothetical protein